MWFCILKKHLLLFLKILTNAPPLGLALPKSSSSHADNWVEILEPRHGWYQTTVFPIVPNLKITELFTISGTYNVHFPKNRGSKKVSQM